MLVVWEDQHWTDPSTLELRGLVINQAPTVLLLTVLHMVDTSPLMYGVL